MKKLLISFALMGLVLPVTGQDEANKSGITPRDKIATKWDVEIPEPITGENRSAPLPEAKPIEFKIKSSRTSRMAVTELSKISDTPPIGGTFNVTVQLVDDPQLPDFHPPLPALPPDDPAVVAKMAELSEKYRGTQLVFLSAEVHANNRTLLTIYPHGKFDGAVTAWSNLDFNHFNGFSTFRVKDGLDGTLHDFALLMGISNNAKERPGKPTTNNRMGRDALDSSALPTPAKGGPAFILVSGDKKSPAMDTLEQIHDLYRNEGRKMEAAYHAREKSHAVRKAYLLANPPKLSDVTIQFWKRTDPSPQGVQALHGGEKP